MNEVVIFKMINGMDYVCTVSSEEDEIYHVENVLVVMPQQGQNTGELHIAFGAAVHPAIGKVDSRKNGAVNLPLRKSAVIFTYHPTEEVRAGYTQAITGIQIAKTLPGRM